jgi:glycerol-3-phosphate dehydrogenase subunit C
VAGHTRDIHTLLWDLTQIRDSHLFRAREAEKGAAPLFPERLAYHAPCHLRAAGRGEEPKRLVEKLLGARFVVTSAKCCGMGGTYGLKSKNAEVSAAIARETFDCILASGAEAVVTSCGMCRTQLAAGTGLPVYHPMELLALALVTTQ